MTNPAIATLRTERDRKAAELDALLVSVKEIKTAIKAFDEALAVLGAAPSLTSQISSSETQGKRIPLKEIIVEILNVNPGLMTLQIQEELRNRGREADVNTILGTLSRMNRLDASIHKQGSGWFVGAGKIFDGDVSSESVRATAKAEALTSTLEGEHTGTVKPPGKEE